ncbi:LOW QUALITY PROTEIN: striated muscle preferentially expressed protein kinase-like [Neosynchiropus ocellatus]
MIPKQARTGPKLFDKIQSFEERKVSVDLKGRELTSSGNKMTGDPKTQGGNIPQDAARKRSAFKQRAASFEDKTSYSEMVQSYQSKFAEELQRIKKLVGKPSLKKAYSTEQLSQKERLATGKLEPIPLQVVEKLEARERAQEGTRAGQQKGRGLIQSSEKDDAPGSSQLKGKPAVDGSSQKDQQKSSVTMETPPVCQLPRQPLPTVTTMRLTGDGSHQTSPTKVQTEDMDYKTDSRSRPTGKRVALVTEPVFPPKSQGLALPAGPGVSPLLKRNKAAVRHTSQTPKVIIPTILVEDEPMETECGADSEGKQRRRRKGRGCHGQPSSLKSPEDGRLSDDSYVSADDEAPKAPGFERPPEDRITLSGREAALTCTPKASVEVRNCELHELKCGQMHMLVINQMTSDHTGSYCITAANTAGRASCSAVLSIQSHPTHVPRGRSREQGTPLDEDQLSPLEEAMAQGHSAAATRRVQSEEPPSFQIPPCDQRVTEGQDVVIAVRVGGLPKPTVCWSKEQVALKIGGRLSMQQTHDGSQELTIRSAERSDSGHYICKIVNELGSKQEGCRVVVRALTQTPLKILRGLEDIGVRAGESAIFECQIDGPPDVDVDWLSNGKLIQPALLNCKMHFDGKRCRLLLSSVHEDDSGTYTCKLSSAKEELTSSASLTVSSSREPLFTRKLDILEVIEGRTARFDCKVSGSPAPCITWMHFETPVQENNNFHFLKEGGRHSLIITHVSSETEGFYTAVAQNIYGKSECTAELYMQEHRPAISSHMSKLEKMPSIPEEPEMLEGELERRIMPDFSKPLGDMEVIEGKEVVLKCRVSGQPYPTIAWYHNGKVIDSSEERKTTQQKDVHHLVIRSACHAHSGVYKAVISNKVGKAACYAHLYVTDIVPDPPDGPPVVEAITGKTICLSWKRPKRLDSSFESAPLMYVVQQQPLGSIQWSVVASSLRDTSYTVTSLTKGVRYAFRVLTSTGKLFSKPSPSTDLVQLLDRGPYLRKAPVFVDKPDVLYVAENLPATVTVTLNHVHAVVTWKRRGVVLASKPGMYEMSMPDDDQHSLKIQRFRSTDVGQLLVTSSNQFGSDLCTVQLIMAVAPKFESIMEDVEVHAGETSRLMVVVAGKPDPDILWFKDDVILSESSFFTFVYDDPEYSLVVLNARPEHSGVYTCTAKNLGGSNSCKAELTVLTERKPAPEPMEDEATILRKMRRLTDYYDVHKEIGRGAYSYVKRVARRTDKTNFAAKFISSRGKRKAPALRELDLLSKLNNEHVLCFHDAFEKKNAVVLITELCHEELLERMAKKTTVSEVEIRSSIQQILEGLRYLHQKSIAHLDIKPENILMSKLDSDQIRICDFGSAVQLEASEEQYCKYGTPEYVAPEIVNQTPVSTATDIWPVGVIAYLCLTGVSPFAGENDRATTLNIRNYNVAFEEKMFAGLCKEARGFTVKLLVVDRLRPNATECLRHPWFKAAGNKIFSTAKIKQVLSRRQWQRSLISYKSKMVMRAIPELLNDSSNHISIAVARHLNDGSPPMSSSSDSEADVDELPFVPMPLSTEFSSSRISLKEFPEDDDVSGSPAVDRGRAGARSGSDVNKRTESVDDAITERRKHALFQKGSSVEADESQTRSRRAPMRRGSSADSALILHIDPDDAKSVEDAQSGHKSLKNAVSMELPNRSASPSVAKISQEDYALKLELMRQRLLRGGSMDKNMSGLRGPLFETLGMDDGQTGSLDKKLRRSGPGPSTLTRAASTENAGEDTPKTKVFQKSASFSHGDTEPMPLHRRFGAPLEIPSAGPTAIEGYKLQEATSMSLLAEQTEPASPPTLKREGLEQQKDEESGMEEKKQAVESGTRDKSRSDSRSSSSSNVLKVEEEKDSHMNEDKATAASSALTYSPVKTSGPSHTNVIPEHPAVFAKVAPPERSQSSDSSATDPGQSRQPVLRSDIKDIDSETIFEARFKKRESSLTRGLRKLTRNKSEEKSPSLSRKVVKDGEEVYRPGPRGAPVEMVPKGLQEKSKSVQDLREEDKEPGLGLIGRLSLRAKRSSSVDKKVEKSKEENRPMGKETAGSKRVSWAMGLSKSLDAKEMNGAGAKKHLDKQDLEEAEESSVSAMRRKFESKVAGMSVKIKTQSGQRAAKESHTGKTELQRKDLKIVTDSPVLGMRQRFEAKATAQSSKIRSQSEERAVETEGKRTQLFSRHRHSHSEGRGLKGIGVPENQLAKQVSSNASKESVESTSSIHSEKEGERRSRWDRWGLTRSKREKTPSQTDGSHLNSEKHIRSASDFPPIFHIKLKDHVLLEGEPVTLTCLPAGSPPPKISWMKDRKPLEVNDRITLTSHPDGRQLLMILKTTQVDAGVYECNATNPIATITTSCTLSIASIPKTPGTPEVPQTYNNTALVLWKPADAKSPCSYTLERKTEGESNWMTVATEVLDCYYNVTDLPPKGVLRFRVCCVNKAGQGPYSSPSAPVDLDSSVRGASSGVAVVNTTPSPPVVASSVSIAPLRPTTTPSTAAAASQHQPTAAVSALLSAVMDESSKTAPRFCSTSKGAPSFVSPKAQSPVNVVIPMTQTQSVLTPPTTPTKPAVSCVPSYAPLTTTAAHKPLSPVSFSPQVLQTSSLSPIGDGAMSPTTGTPPGPGPTTSLRQGVPQKPYTFLDEKSRGRFGVVRECRENATGKIYMAKIIPYSKENKANILKEYEILKLLRNEKILTLHEAYVTPRYLVLVEEYCTGKELLYSLIDRFRYSEDDVVGYLVQIIQGVEYLHNRRVLHLDLKPDNILVTNLNCIKIVDFGSAQTFNPLSLKHQESGTGTLEYMAPEMLKGEVVGPPADLWTVGVVIHIMLSGRLPFEDRDPSCVESKILMAKFDPTKLYPNVSQSASAFVKKMLSSYPWARPTTRDCFSHTWLQDSYLMKLKRQTLTFTTGRLKEFLVEQQYHRTESATKHKVLLRTYQSSDPTMPGTTGQMSYP